MKAVLETLRVSTTPLSIDEIVSDVETRTQRRCDNRAVISCLRAADAIFDASSGGWITASDATQMEADEIEDTSPEHRLPAVELLTRLAGE
jgi:hypothetical protein